MHVNLDLLGGIAGDMFIAAVLDAWPDLTDGLRAAVHASGLPETWRVSLEDHSDGVLRGKRFIVAPAAHHDAHHHHRSYRDIARGLRESALDGRVSGRASAIFELLARAEADVHGIDVDEVTFHEVGSWDSVADIVGAAYLIEALAPASWSVAPIPLGGGRITTAHGGMPVPAPATVKLLQGFAVIDDGIEGERVTPTGAAILRYLSDLPESMMYSATAPKTLERSGMGFGTRRLPGISNVARVLAFQEATTGRIDDRVTVIQFEIDDQTAEDLAVALDSLRKHEAVLDALQIPAFGKKGRMVFHIQILCRPDALDDVIARCFKETTTLGLRWSTTGRAKLGRESIAVRLDDDIASVKLAARPDGRTSAKTEIDEVTGSDLGYAGRTSRRRHAEGLAIAESQGAGIVRRDEKQNR